MDPDACLAEIRSLIATTYLPEVGPDGEERTGVDDPERFVFLVEALDGWICSGGMMPLAWVR